MKQVRPVTGANLIEFAEAMNEAYCELSRFQIERTDTISDLSALIYYDIPDELVKEDDPVVPELDPDYTIEFGDEDLISKTITIQLKVGDTPNRHCCECDNYRWGHGCPYSPKHIRLMDPACHMFNVIIERR